MDFSSWPREQEQTFVVYEQRSSESQKKAFTIALIAAIGALVLALGIYAGIAPEKQDLGKDMNMSNLSKRKAEPAPTPAPADKPADPPADKK
ncbi:MAG: hypothetical protein ACM31C_19445 [Acidobacteriota bacterium]